MLGIFDANTSDVPERVEMQKIVVREPLSVIKEKKIWSERIESVGAERAYAEYKETFATAPFSAQHLLAHMMGELLYEKEGIDGLKICDATFAFGCYHSFFGRALSEKGTDVITLLDASCVRAYGPLGTGCQHGIGHGIVEYMGGKDIAKALDLCSKTTQLKALFGCTSGVFMEYNTPTITSGVDAESQTRLFDIRKPYDPCDGAVAERYRESCYYEIVAWWQRSLSADYTKMGALCLGIKKATERDACLLGVGNTVAPSTLYDVAKTIDMCTKMPNRISEILCRAGASWSFFAEPRVRMHANEVCEMGNQKEKDTCMKRSNLIGNEERFNKL